MRACSIHSLRVIASSLSLVASLIVSVFLYNPLTAINAFASTITQRLPLFAGASDRCHELARLSATILLF